VLAGTLGAILVVRWIGGVTGVDGLTFSWIWIAGPMAVAVGALVAALLPARWITKLDPLTAMRTD
jgi:hypothetical protein